jgi:hypothetical protein
LVGETTQAQDILLPHTQELAVLLTQMWLLAVLLAS